MAKPEVRMALPRRSLGARRCSILLPSPASTTATAKTLTRRAHGGRLQQHRSTIILYYALIIACSPARALAKMNPLILYNSKAPQSTESSSLQSKSALHDCSCTLHCKLMPDGKTLEHEQKPQGNLIYSRSGDGRSFLFPKS